MRSKFASRIWWYVALGLITIAVVRIRAPILGAAFFSAVAWYVPVSLLWMLLGPLLQRALPRNTKPFGIKEQTLLTSVILGGVCVSTLFLILGQATVASLGILTILGGIDGVILSREARAAIAARMVAVEKGG
jgi:FtsH-binding integral membrane protein